MYQPENLQTIINSGNVVYLRGIFDRIPAYLFSALNSCIELDLAGGSATDMDFYLPDPMVGSNLKALNLYGNKIVDFDSNNFSRFALSGQVLLASVNLGANDFTNYNFDFNGSGITTLEEFICNDALQLQNASLSLETANTNSLKKIEIKNNPLLNYISTTLNGAGLTNATFRTINFSGNALNGQCLHALLTDWALCAVNDSINGVQVDVSGGTTQQLPEQMTYSGGSWSQGDSITGYDGGGSPVATGIILSNPAGSQFIFSRETGDWSLAVSFQSAFASGVVSSIAAHPAIGTLTGASWTIASN